MTTQKKPTRADLEIAGTCYKLARDMFLMGAPEVALKLEAIADRAMGLPERDRTNG